MRYVILGVALVMAAVNVLRSPTGATIRAHWDAETERHARVYQDGGN